MTIEELPIEDVSNLSREQSNLNTRFCLVCKEDLPVNKFEKTRNTCITCRSRETRKKRNENNKKSSNQEVIYQKKQKECNGKCQHCGLINYLLITFDHLEPENKARTKNGNTINSISNLSMRNLQLELDKPHEWICHNCHKIKTNETTSSETMSFGQIVRHEIINSLGKVCELCGENRIDSLCFDHIDETLKLFTIGDKFQQMRLRIDGGIMPEETIKKYIEDIISEVEKCGLLCENCNWLKQHYRMQLNSKLGMSCEYFETSHGKEWIEKLKNYKSKERQYDLCANEIFEIANIYKNQIINEKFNEQKNIVDSQLYHGDFEKFIHYSQYGRTTISDFILHITSNKNKKELPLWICKSSEKLKPYRLIIHNKHMGSFKNLQDAIDRKNDIIRGYLKDDLSSDIIERVIEITK